MAGELTPAHDICLLYGNGCQHETEFAIAAVAGTREVRIGWTTRLGNFRPNELPWGLESMTNDQESHGEGHNCVEVALTGFHLVL